MITMNATIATGKHSPFLRMPMFVASVGGLRACQDGESPIDDAHGGAHSHGGAGRGFGATTSLHAWLSVAAFAVGFPLAALFARHGRARDATLTPRR